MVIENITSETESAEDVTKIIRLNNSFLYAISHVFIILHKKDVRLMVMNRKIILCDQIYGNSRGAKIAFDRLFKKRVFQLKKLKPSWTKPYPVELSWLIPRLEMAERLNFETLSKDRLAKEGGNPIK